MEKDKNLDRETIGKVLRKYRTEQGYTVDTVVSMLREREFSLSEKTLYGWEAGHSLPTAQLFMELCRIYGIRDVLTLMGEEGEDFLILTPLEKALVQAYRQRPGMHRAVLRLLEIEEWANIEESETQENTGEPKEK